MDNGSGETFLYNFNHASSVLSVIINSEKCQDIKQEKMQNTSFITAFLLVQLCLKQT